MRFNALLITGLIAASPAIAFAQDAPPAAPEAPEAPADPSVADVIKQYDDAYKAWSADYRAAKKEGRQATVRRPNAMQWAPQVLAAVERAATEGEAVGGLSWIFRQVRYGDVRAKAMALATEKYLGHPGMGAVCSGFRSDGTPAAAAFLKALMAKGENDTVKGMACFALANSLRRQASTARFLQGKDADYRARYARTYGQAAVDGWLKADADALEKEAEGHFEACVKAGGNVAQQAATELYELRNLAIGKTAPEIDGTDPAGEAFKLSDYRGKVVVIDFWGDW
ncbi:MAG: TlpA family protein disulfide reductase [Planctomycetota bacterium]|jgi:hypothetical protein